MKIFKGFTYQLYPTSEQLEQFEQFSGVCRLVWNLALEQRVHHWRQYQSATGDNLNYVTQSRQLAALRREFDFIRAVSQTSKQRALKNLDATFQRFFNGQGGYPKYKRKGNGDSFSFVGREVRVERINRKWSHVRLPKIGKIKFRNTRDMVGEIREATVIRTALGWQISIGCLDERDVTVCDRPAVGVDRGVVIPMMCSDGTEYYLPERFSKLERLHKRIQRKAARRKRGSNRHRKMIARAAKIKARQARIRKDWAHRCTTDIARRCGTVFIEKLRTKNMVKSAKGTVESPGVNVAQKRGLNRSILNVGWQQIEMMLSYKTKYAGGELIKVNPAFTSQTCPACGAVHQKSRKSQAIFSCVDCAYTDNADYVAAVNILNRGNTAVLDVEGVHSIAPFEASTSVSEIPRLQPLGRC